MNVRFVVGIAVRGVPMPLSNMLSSGIVSAAAAKPSRLLKKPQTELNVLPCIWDFRSSRRYPTGFHTSNRPRRRLGRSSDTLIPPAVVPAFE